MQIGVVSLIHPKYHGVHNDVGEILVEAVFEHDEWKDATQHAAFVAKNWRYTRSKVAHPTTANFWHIVSRPQLHLIRTRTAADGSQYATIHTTWVRQIQRRWRTLLEERRERLIELSTPAAVLYQQQHGSVMPTKLSVSEWWRQRCDWMT
jgi:hypothetical protein